MYVMAVPSSHLSESFMAETHSDTSSGRSASFNIIESRDSLSPRSTRRSNASSGDAIQNTPDSTFSLGEILLRSAPTPNGSSDRDANFPGDMERIIPSEDTVPTPTANDDEPLSRTLNATDDEQNRMAKRLHLVQIGDKVMDKVPPLQVFNSVESNSKGSHRLMSITSRDLEAHSQTGMCEPGVSGDLNERLSVALKLNEDLQNRLVQAEEVKVELEQALHTNFMNTDALEQQVLNLVMAKAEGEWKLVESQQKVVELQERLILARRIQDTDSKLQSSSREDECLAKPNSISTKLFEESIFSTENSYESQQRLDEAESRLATLTSSQPLTESHLKTATREKRELNENKRIATQMMEEACMSCKTLRSENLRLGGDLLAMRALLTKTQEELQTQRKELDQTTVRNIQ